MARILVIDDCTTTLDLLKSRLEMDGHNVVPTDSGKQALGLIRCATFDLIITDLYMPDADGLEILSQVHALAASVPIIAISANGLMMDMFPVARSLGAVATVQKPIDIEHLNLAIKAALG